MVDAARGQRKHDSFDQRAAIGGARPIIKIGKRQHEQRRGKRGGQLSGGVNQEAQAAEKHAEQGSIAAGALIDPEPREPVDTDRYQQNRRQLYQQERHTQPEDEREDRDPLVRERRIGRLGKSSKPLRVPRVEPVMRVVRREKHVEVRVIGTGQRQLQAQQRPVNGQRQQNNEPQRNRSRKVAGFHRGVFPPRSSSVSTRLDSSSMARVFSRGVKRGRQQTCNCLWMVGLRLSPAALNPTGVTTSASDRATAQSGKSGASKRKLSPPLAAPWSEKTFSSRSCFC